MLVGLATDLPNLMIPGSDWPYIKEVMQEVASEPGMLRSPHYCSWPDEGLIGQEGDEEILSENTEELLDMQCLISQGQFRADQQQEDAFWHISENNVASWDWEVIGTELMEQKPWFEVRDDTLYQIDKGMGKGEEITQILVPHSYRNPLWVAHILSLGGHLGRDKAVVHLVNCFFWLGIKREVEQFSGGCQACQKVSTIPPPTRHSC